MVCFLQQRRIVWQKQNHPDMIAELLCSEDYTTDEEESNDDDDGDSNEEIKATRRKMKNIRLRKKATRTTPPKGKVSKLAARRPAGRVQPPKFIKSIVSRNKQDKVGTTRLFPQINEKAQSERAMPAPKQTRPSIAGRSSYTLPPFPLLQSGKTPIGADTALDLASEKDF